MFYFENNTPENAVVGRLLLRFVASLVSEGEKGFKILRRMMKLKNGTRTGYETALSSKVESHDILDYDNLTNQVRE